MVEIEGGGGRFEDVRHLVAGARGRRVYETGEPDHGIWWAGLTQGLIEDIPTVRELVVRMVAEAEALISGRLARMTAASATPLAARGRPTRRTWRSSEAAANWAAD